ncbi:MAG: hypothetical protein U9R10_05640, partial [Euryarchaeota archaeon]|nr:hypothetical protein [Euryarchaeota archaeon]
MKNLLVLCSVVLVLGGMTPSVTAEAAGGITLNFTQFTDQLEIATQLEKPSYGIATLKSEEPTESTSMNIRVVKVEDNVETTSYDTNVTPLDDFSIPLDSGTYKVYTQLAGDDTVLEYNNNSEGYEVTSERKIVIPMVYSPSEGYILDVPWRIENSEMYIPILAVADDRATYADINNIYVYDHNNGDSFVTSTNWDSAQPIDSSNIPFFYLFNVDKNLFVQVDGTVSLKIK